MLIYLDFFELLVEFFDKWIVGYVWSWQVGEDLRGWYFYDVVQLFYVVKGLFFVEMVMGIYFVLFECVIWLFVCILYKISYLIDVELWFFYVLEVVDGVGEVLLQMVQVIQVIVLLWVLIFEFMFFLWVEIWIGFVVCFVVVIFDQLIMLLVVFFQLLMLQIQWLCDLCEGIVRCLVYIFLLEDVVVCCVMFVWLFEWCIKIEIGLSYWIWCWQVKLFRVFELLVVG